MAKIECVKYNSFFFFWIGYEIHMRQEIIAWLYTFHILYIIFLCANTSTALNHERTEHSPVERIWTIQKSKRSCYKKLKKISWLLNIAHLVPAYFRINNYNCVEFQRMRNKLIHLNSTKCWQQYGKERRPHVGNDYKTLKANSYLKFEVRTWNWNFAVFDCVFFRRWTTNSNVYSMFSILNGSIICFSQWTHVRFYFVSAAAVFVLFDSHNFGTSSLSRSMNAIVMKPFFANNKSNKCC